MSTLVAFEQEISEPVRRSAPEISDAALRWFVAQLAWERRLAALRDSQADSVRVSGAKASRA